MPGLRSQLLCIRKLTYTHYHQSFNGMARGFFHPQQENRHHCFIFINNYLPMHMCPHFILSDSGTEFKNQLMDSVLHQLGIDCIFSAPITHRVMENWKLSMNTLSPPLRNCVKRIQTNVSNASTKY